MIDLAYLCDRSGYRGQKSIGHCGDQKKQMTRRERQRDNTRHTRPANSRKAQKIHTKADTPTLL